MFGHCKVVSHRCEHRRVSLFPRHTVAFCMVCPNELFGARKTVTRLEAFRVMRALQQLGAEASKHAETCDKPIG